MEIRFTPDALNLHNLSASRAVGFASSVISQSLSKCQTDAILSNKDIKDWKNFVESNEKVHNKDNSKDQIKFKTEATIDLHGFSLDQVNRSVEKFITDCFKKKVLKLNISLVASRQDLKPNP